MAPIFNFSTFSEKATDKTPNTSLAPCETAQTPTDKTPSRLGFVTDKTPLSASWVLADLFGVTALELLIPDHVLENEPGLELIPCPECGGEGWLEAYGSAWGASCEAWGRPDLDFTLKPCSRCHCEGEVLGLSEPAPLTPAGLECDRCKDTGWVDAEPTPKTLAAGFRYLLGQGVCSCGAWRHAAVDRAKTLGVLR